MESKDKVIRLFKYIKELYGQKYQVISDIIEQEWVKFISDISDEDSNIIKNYMDRTDEEVENNCENIILLQVAKPEFEKPPILPDELNEWVKNGWERFNQPLEKITEKTFNDIQGNELRKNTEHCKNLFNVVFFDDSELRINLFDSFSKERDIWVERQKEINNTRNLFNELHLKYIDLERDSETIEMMIGQGILSCKTDSNKTIRHPILVKKVSMQFDALNNIISIVDTDSNPEIYTMLLNEISYINHLAINEIEKQLLQEYYHPLDRNDTPDFLKSVVHKLHAKSVYLDNENTSLKADEKLVISSNPVFFIRKRTGGVVKAIKDIIKQIKRDGKISAPLLSLIGENTERADEPGELLDIDDILRAISGEDKDILLSKEANREQLEIAKRIENYDAVLVQGPPGTGKTHTIANLMGHFLSQGKKILVTSHTKKALSVVKEKVPRELQNLCVSVLDDNSKDMESSIDGITKYISSHSSLGLLQDIEKLKYRRDKIITDLNDVRRNIFNIKHKEFETIIFGGESFSVSQAAKYVYDNSNELSNIISGKVAIGKPFPITSGDLALVYKTNELISVNDEQELEASLPNPNKILTPQEFSFLITNENAIIEKCSRIIDENSLKLNIDYANCKIFFNNNLLCEEYDKENLSILKAYLTETDINLKSLDSWCSYAILDGKKGGGHKKAWETLVLKIENTYNHASNTVELFLGKSVEGNFTTSTQTILTIKEIKEYIAKGKKLNSFTLFKPKQWKQWKELYNNIKINGQSIETINDCDILIEYCQLAAKREEIANFWKELIEKRGGV